MTRACLWQAAKLKRTRVDGHRIVSLIPSATEIVAALGCADVLVGRSHECDFPPSVVDLPVCTQPKIDVHTTGEIDRQVRMLVEQGLSVYRVLTDVLEQSIGNGSFHAVATAKLLRGRPRRSSNGSCNRWPAVKHAWCRSHRCRCVTCGRTCALSPTRSGDARLPIRSSIRIAAGWRPSAGERPTALPGRASP